jgi:hypothetical protein
MSNTSQARKDRRLAKRTAAKEPVVNTIRPVLKPPADPLGDLARAELAKITEQEELAALSGDGGDLWKEIEGIYRNCSTGLVQLLREIADLNDRSVLNYMTSPEQFTDRVLIFHNDVKQAVEELKQIHALHEHRLNDNSGPRETMAGMEIVETYTAWQAKTGSLLDKTMMELVAMFDEARRKKMAAEAAAAGAQDVNVVTDVAFEPVADVNDQRISQADYEIAMEIGKEAEKTAASMGMVFDPVVSATDNVERTHVNVDLGENFPDAVGTINAILASGNDSAAVTDEAAATTQE